MQTPPCPVKDAVGGGRLEGGAKVRNVLRSEGSKGGGLPANGRLQPGEREMGLGTACHGTRERKAIRPAGGCSALDRGSAWSAKPKELGSLVEGFAKGVVDGRRQALIVADAVNDKQLSMTTGNKQQQIR